MTPAELWQRYCSYLCASDSLGLSLDVSRMRFDDAFFGRMEPAMQAAFEAMEALERGAIANPDEGRTVGHYWLRAPELAPTAEIRGEIERTRDAVRRFAADVRAGRVRPARAERFTDVISIGIGGSALGPMFVSDALGGSSRDALRMHFIDNTDPDGIQRTLARLAGTVPVADALSRTLVLVVSKSGGTPETRNGMLLVAEACRAAGLDFAPHAVAVTAAGSRLDRQAQREGWLARFPMWDWVGGRTSVTSAVGLLPAALEGVDVDALLAGAAECDRWTRSRTTRANPAALLALMWHHATGGRGGKDMVVLPYCDRLLLLPRYLQQLVMESLGKRLDLGGRVVEQGLTVFGNKGSTDQHAYVQQLRDGLNNFFVAFVRVLETPGDAVEVDAGIRAGDYLHGFLLGTRAALFENGRESMTITLDRVDARSVGALIALFERAVGLYAGLIGVNAYDQPGVEAGKKAAAAVLELQRRVAAALTSRPQSAEDVARAIGVEDVEGVWLVLERLAASGRAHSAGAGPPSTRGFAYH